MDGKSSSWTVHDKHGRDVADNQPWRCQASFNTNHIPSHSGEALTEESYGERWGGDFPSACPSSLPHKEPVTVMHGVLSEGAPSSSSSTHNAHQQDLKRENSSTWSSVIKESLEISNGMELEQGLLAAMYGSPLIYDSRAEELAKKHVDPEDNKPTLLNLSFKDCPSNPNQELGHETEPLMCSSSLDDEELCETRCRTRKRCSSLGLHDAAEVCALENTKISPVTKRRCFSEDGGAVVSNQRSTSLNEHVSLTGNEKHIPVLKQAPQHGSPREHAASHINAGKSIANQTKSCSDINATLHRHLNMPGHHLRSTEPTYSSTSDRKGDLVHDLPEENPPTLNSMKHLKAPVEISRTLGESDEANSPSEPEESTRNGSVTACTTGDPDVATTGARSSCKLLRQRENAGLLPVDDALTCSQSSDETSSLNANNTSQMIINTDQETDNVHVITENIKVGTLGVCSNAETGGNRVYSPQTPRAEARPAHETRLDCESSDVILTNARSHVCTKKSSLKKRKFQNGKTATVQEPDVAACSERSYRNLKIQHENQDSVSGSTSNTFHTDQSNRLQKTPESQRKEATGTESRKHRLWKKRSREEPRRENPRQEKPRQEKPHSEKPHQEKPRQEKPRQEKPHSEKPHREKPHREEPRREKPHREEPRREKPHREKPHREEPRREKPRREEPRREKPHQEEPRRKKLCREEPPRSEVNGAAGFEPSAEIRSCIITRSVAGQVKGAETAKYYIRCKYCRRSFRHISAYTVHQRIHTGEKPYRCELCGKNFAQLSKLKSHKNVHSRSASLPCPCCRRTFAEKRDLIAHFTSHVKEQKNVPGQDRKPDAPLKNPTCSTSGRVQDIPEPDQDELVSCKTCGKEFQTWLQLADHEKTHWPVKPYACSVCARSFTRIKALKKHSEEHTGETPFSCSQCDSAFCDLPGLRAHQISKPCSRSLNGENRDIEGFLVTHGVDGQVNTPVFFRCHICRQLYRKWCQYTLHLQTHTNAPPYLCFACGQSYNKDFEISLHCGICCQTSGEEAACGSSLSEIFQPRKDSSLTEHSPDVETSKSRSLSSAGQVHENLSTVQKEQLLPEFSQVVNDVGLPPSPTSLLNESLGRVEQSQRNRCGQRYKRSRSLRFHTQTHAAAFRYSCGRCGCSFKRWSRLWLHQQSHRRKVRRYTCSQCNIRFHHYSSYKMHLLKHAEERPSTCPLYPQTCVHKQGLHVHQCEIQQPARTLQPEGCTRSFSNLTNLVKHGLLHNGAITQQCLLCNLPCANSRSLKEHLNVYHDAVSLLPSIPSEPLRFIHKCNRCKSSFSTGDLLYAHQICHTRDLKPQVRSTQSSESTSARLEGTQRVSSTSRCLLSSLDLDAVPNKSLYKYPHPDELYVPARVSRMSKRLPIINLDVGDEDQEASTDPVCPKKGGTSKEQKVPESSQTDTTHQPQVPERRESVRSPNRATTGNFQTEANGDSPTRTHEYVETSVYLEGPVTTVNPAENESQDEMFECADCSEHVGSLIGLYEHYFLHALGNAHLYRSV